MLSVNNLCKTFGGTKAVDNISFEIEKPGVTVIMGASGCGKTTLLRLLAGLEIPDSGEVHLDGNLASKKGWALEPHQRGMGFVFQSPALWPHMTVKDNIQFGLPHISKQTAEQKLKETLKEMDLSGLENRYPDEISGGQARRVALARSIIIEPKYLLLDEPLTNVDMALKARLLDFIQKKIADTTASLIYVTHDTEEAKKILGNILVMDDGQLK